MGESRATTPQVRINVWESGCGEGNLPSEPTPTEYEQLVNLANKTKQIAQSVRDDADSGFFKGENGDTGDVSTEYLHNNFASSIKNTVSGEKVSVKDVSAAEQHEALRKFLCKK